MSKTVGNEIVNDIISKSDIISKPYTRGHCAVYQSLGPMSNSFSAIHTYTKVCLQASKTDYI